MQLDEGGEQTPDIHYNHQIPDWLDSEDESAVEDNRTPGTSSPTAVLSPTIVPTRRYPRSEASREAWLHHILKLST